MIDQNSRILGTFNVAIVRVIANLIHMGMLHPRDYISTAYIFEKWSEQSDDFFFYWIDNNRKELVA